MSLWDWRNTIIIALAEVFLGIAAILPTSITELDPSWRLAIITAMISLLAGHINGGQGSKPNA